MISLICLLVITHLICYEVDKKLITLDKDPRLAKQIVSRDDGGSTLYYGIGYQVIKWNRLSTRYIEDKEVRGYVYGDCITLHSLTLQRASYPNCMTSPIE